jgi:3-hydroxybutyryl-CoA dehydrogenase
MLFSRVGVVGAGMMGSEIAMVFALAGRDVVLTDRDAARAADALARIGTLLERGVARGFYSADEARTALARLRVEEGIAAHADRDLVVEAVFEDEGLKGGIYRELDGVLATDAVIASNTSSISITVLSSHLPEGRRPRFLGTHFFSPVSRMKLVEVIPSLDTDADLADKVTDELRAIGKQPIRVKDVVGFAVNRLIHIFWIEAARLVEEGVCTAREVDIGCKLGLGHPVGPFELMDGVTNNLTLDVQQILHEAYGERFLPRPLLKQMVAAGYNGRRHGRGWYRYGEKGERQDESR